jgi:hypothetical protein
LSTRPSAAAPAVSPYAQSVFVNCPFDDWYLPLLHAMLFAIHDCGFVARLAVEDTGGSEMRIDRITRIIRESRYSIHDLSRVEGVGPGATHLPRFNMPFEAGLAMGATRFEPIRPASTARDFLLMDSVKHRPSMTLSDLAGQDPKTHADDPEKIVSAVRGFLAAKAKPKAVVGATEIWKRYQKFRAELPNICIALKITEVEMTSFGYLPDLTQAMALWLRTHP